MKNEMANYLKRRGFMLVLSSPSGAGKTTISHRILEDERDIDLSVSVTTRPKRPSEIEGEDYIFVDEETFQKMVERGSFLEHALVHGYHYGTPQAAIEEQLAEGRDVLFDIDWQGTQQLKQIALHDLVSIFLLPPSMEELKARLLKRSEDSTETIQKRLSKADDEVSHWAEYDYVLINDSLEETVESVRSILHAERLKRRRQLGLATFVNQLHQPA